MITGDALFAGSIGRTDLPGGDYPQLINSIRNKLLELPDSTVVYPGHGPATTIGAERQNNPFLRQSLRTDEKTSTKKAESYLDSAFMLNYSFNSIIRQRQAERITSERVG